MEGGIDWRLECGQSVLVSHYQGSKLITEQTQTRANYLARVLAYVPRQERLGAHECARNHARKGNKRCGGGGRGGLRETERKIGARNAVGKFQREKQSHMAAHLDPER